MIYSGFARLLPYFGAAVVVVVGLDGSALGQTPEVRDSEPARVQYERATAAYGLGNFSEAALAYEKAFELKPDPALLYNAAQAHRRGGNRQRAIELYRSFLQVFPRNENREVAERHLDELERAALGQPPPAGSTGSLPLAAAPLPSPVVPAPEIAAPPPPVAAETRAAARPKLWRQPWLWIAVGATALVAGTVAAFALSGKNEPRPSWGRVGP